MLGLSFFVGYSLHMFHQLLPFVFFQQQLLLTTSADLNTEFVSYSVLTFAPTAATPHAVAVASNATASHGAPLPPLLLASPARVSKYI